MRLFPVKFCESCQCIWIWEHFQATAFSAYQYSQVSISLRSNIHITNDGLLKLQWSAQLEEQYNNNDVRNNCSVRLIYLATCTTDDCVCVCVCLYSFICWFLQTARRLWHTWDVRINDLLLWVLLGAFAKFLHLRIWKCHISPPKTKTPARYILERKQYDILASAKRWYMLM